MPGADTTVFGAVSSIASGYHDCLVTPPRGQDVPLITLVPHKQREVVGEELKATFYQQNLEQAEQVAFAFSRDVPAGVSFGCGMLMARP